MSEGGIITDAIPGAEDSLLPSYETAVGRGTTSVYEQMVVSAFPDAPVMVEIARAESQFNPAAKNKNSSATGLFQVLRGTRDAYGCGDQTIPEESIKCARKIYEAEGTSPWDASAHMR